MIIKTSNYTVLHYPGYFKVPAWADVNIYEMDGGQIVVLISQPRAGYTGLSVTNGIERIVTEIHHSLNVPCDATFIEHYSAEDDFDRQELDKPSFDLVTFNWGLVRLAAFLPLRISAFGPRWKPLGRDGFTDLTGSDPEGV